jgi:hypothetical protein
VIAGERDPGAEELYFALQARRVECALATLEVSRPSRTILEWEATLSWLTK